MKSLRNIICKNGKTNNYIDKKIKQGKILFNRLRTYGHTVGLIWSIILSSFIVDIKKLILVRDYLADVIHIYIDFISDSNSVILLTEARFTDNITFFHIIRNDNLFIKIIITHRILDINHKKHWKAYIHWHESNQYVFHDLHKIALKNINNYEDFFWLPIVTKMNVIIIILWIGLLYEISELKMGYYKKFSKY